MGLVFRVLHEASVKLIDGGSGDSIELTGTEFKGINGYLGFENNGEQTIVEPTQEFRTSLLQSESYGEFKFEVTVNLTGVDGVATIDPAANASRGELTIDVQAPLFDPGGDLLSLVPASDPARTDVSWSETTVVKGEGSSEISNGIKRGAPLSSLIRAVSQAIGRVLRIGENSSNTNSEDEAIDSSSYTLIVPH